MSALAPVAPKLAKTLRLLASDRDGEVLAAVAALRRTLCSAGADLHDLAAAVEAIGRSRPEHRQRRATPVPAWSEMAYQLRERAHRLQPHERAFVENMCRRTANGSPPTERQAKWLRDLWHRLAEEVNA